MASANGIGDVYRHELKLAACHHPGGMSGVSWPHCAARVPAESGFLTPYSIGVEREQEVRLASGASVSLVKRVREQGHGSRRLAPLASRADTPRNPAADRAGHQVAGMEMSCCSLAQAAI
jgi:hypothetical protein